MCLAVCLQSIHYEREREKIANVIPFTTNILYICIDLQIKKIKGWGGFMLKLIQLIIIPSKYKGIDSRIKGDWQIAKILLFSV